MVYLRNADDALHLKELFPEAKDVIVVGGGFIGLEAAASLHEMSKNVTVLEHGPKLIDRAVGEQTSEYFLDAQGERGLDARFETQIDEILHDDNGHVNGQKQELAGINHGVTVERLMNYPRVQSLRTPICECRCG